MNIWAPFAYHSRFVWHATCFFETLRGQHVKGIWSLHCDSIVSSEWPSKCRLTYFVFFVCGGVFTFRGPCAVTCSAHRPWPPGRCEGAQRNAVEVVWNCSGPPQVVPSRHKQYIEPYWAIEHSRTKRRVEWFIVCKNTVFKFIFGPSWTVKNHASERGTLNACNIFFNATTNHWHLWSLMTRCSSGVRSRQHLTCREVDQIRSAGPSDKGMNIQWIYVNIQDRMDSNNVKGEMCSAACRASQDDPIRRNVFGQSLEHFGTGGPFCSCTRCHHSSHERVGNPKSLMFFVDVDSI